MNFIRKYGWPCVRVDEVDRDDRAGWSSRAADRGLGPEPGDVARRGLVAQQQPLQGHDPAQVALPGAVDDPHSAPAQLLEQLAFAEPDAGGRAGFSATAGSDGPLPPMARRSSRRRTTPAAPSPRRSRRRPRVRGARRPASGCRSRDLLDVGRPAPPELVGQLVEQVGEDRSRRSSALMASGLPRGRLAEDRAEPAEGAEVPHPGRRLAQAERLRGLAVGKLLEVPQQDDLAVGLVELPERRLEPPLEVRAAKRWRRRASGSGRGAARPGRATTGRANADAASGLLAVKAPALGDPVPPVLVDHVVARDLPEPEMERHRRVPEVVARAAGSP